VTFRRVPLALPLVFATGCAIRPFTPSVTVAYHAQAVPPDHDVEVPHASTLARAWQLPTDDVWMPFSKMTLLTALGDEGGAIALPEVEDLVVVQNAKRAAARLGSAGIPPGTLLIVDLRGAASVAFGAALVERSTTPVSPILTFQHWPGENELIPAEETLAALVRYAPRAPLTGHGAPVFLLDSWRLAYRFDHPEDDAYDNRYFLQAGDLPDPEFLLAHGIRRVVYLVETRDETDTEEDDLHLPAHHWQQAGIPLFLTDLDWVSRHPLEDAALVADCAFSVRPRRTILADPQFYSRARGGFGGPSTAPYGTGGVFVGGSLWWGGGYRGGG
jgi:hypothetical protein